LRIEMACLGQACAVEGIYHQSDIAANAGSDAKPKLAHRRILLTRDIVALRLCRAAA
jgi:hypothetical protein